MLYIYTDGGSRGNPGNSGIGFVFIEDGKIIYQEYKNIGIKTCNEAEYIAILYAIKKAIELGIKNILIKSDSNLIVSQLIGKWKIKNDRLKKYAIDIYKIIDENNLNIIFEWIPRIQNKIADSLANKGMDLCK